MLKQLFGSTPKWQSPKSQRRLEAVAELQSSVPAEMDVLVKLASEDSEPAVRREAVKKLVNIDLLQQIQRRDLEAPVREAAVARVHDLLAGKTDDAPPLEERLARIKRITATDTLRFLIMEATPIEVRVAAVEQLSDEVYLEDIALKSGIARLRQIAAERISNPRVLESLANLSRHGDKGVYRIARDKLDALHANDKGKRQAEERQTSLCEAMEQHSRSAINPLYKAKIESLLQHWRDVDSPPPPALAERFETALDLANQNLQTHLEQELQQRAREEAADELRATCDTLDQALSELQKQPDQADHPALAALIATQQQRWQAASEIRAPESGMTKRYEKSMAALKEIETLILAVGKVRRALESTIATVQKADAEGDTKNLEPLSQLVASVPPPSQGLPLPSIMKIAYGMLEKRREPAQKPIITSKTRHRPDQEKLRQLTSLLDMLEAAIEGGSSREAQQRLRDVQTFTREHRLHDIRLPGLVSRLQELKDWAGYAVLPKKLALLADMRSLIDKPMDPDEKADLIKALQDEWKALGVANPTQENPLWEEFRVAADKAYEPCRAFFHEQREMRAQNLARREALCVELERYLDSMPAMVTTKQVDAILRTARDEWHRYHPVDRAGNQNLQPRFNKLQKQIEQLLKQVQAQHEQQKRDLIEATRKLVHASDIRIACAEVKILQQQWKTIEAGSRKQDQLLWKEFRELCDLIFARRDHEVEARKAAQAAGIDQAEALIKSQLALAEAALLGEAKAAEAAALAESFNGVSMPRERRADLQQRFEAARQLYQKNLKYAEQHRQEVVINRIVTAFSGCAEAEANRRLTDWDPALWISDQAVGHLEAPWQKLLSRRAAALAERDAPQRLDEQADQHLEFALDCLLELEILLDLPSPPELRTARLQKQLDQLQTDAFRHAAEGREARARARLQALLGVSLPVEADIRQGIHSRLAAILKTGRFTRK